MADQHDQHRPDPQRRAVASQQHGQHQSHNNAKNHRYNAGQRLPAQYRSDRYYVNDWRANHLSEPPKGHRWARVDNSFILVAVASGVITQVLLAK